MKTATIVTIIIWAFYVIFCTAYSTLSVLFIPKDWHLFAGFIFGVICLKFSQWINSFKIKED